MRHVNNAWTDFRCIVPVLFAAVVGWLWQKTSDVGQVCWNTTSYWARCQCHDWLLDGRQSQDKQRFGFSPADNAVTSCHVHDDNLSVKPRRWKMTTWLQSYTDGSRHRVAARHMWHFLFWRKITCMPSWQDKAVTSVKLPLNATSCAFTRRRRHSFIHSSLLHSHSIARSADVIISDYLRSSRWNRPEANWSDATRN